ncbi:S1/P1 Nuclease [Bradyrhizobium sp. INPA01-394B]|uniref:S1/P1 Nuclease n=1 Tax=Bradyrhizobium campsiandrae TaxID=1729892 RepID=A0ABR7U787_9BRAD|nr:S1/P1 Nuclease [Bradyrhizobium campsiandrae]MBC9876638.1 S1/P1 Nuclease [Bradyrhizobium campsiandrae]MBC9979894.1 S1/P1 Nuclease [Bradyrhizobium campsiandrae]
MSKRHPRVTPWLASAAGIVMVLAPQNAWSWGHTGHVGISQIAMQALPPEIPAFVRSAQAIAQVGELGAEADISKTTGLLTSATGNITTTRTVHDSERDPGHFIDLDDNGVVIGGVIPISQLPATRQDFDTQQRSATNPAGQTQYGGYLPYAILDGFQQLRKDFAIWRALSVGLMTATTDADRAYFRFQLQLRQELIIRDIGYWSHFVADASQPMHVSIHFNGWGNYPNPNGYTTAAIHAPFEGAFVRNNINFIAVAGQMRPYTNRGVATMEQRVPLYLEETLAQVASVYQAAKDSNNDNYKSAQPAEIAIVTKQLAAGASELRDEIVDAWRQSASVTVGFPLVRVSDIESGLVKVTPLTLGSD